MSNQPIFSSIEVGSKIDGPVFETSRQSIVDYCEASLDFNPLHLDDEFMAGSVGKSKFEGVIVHGMTTFSIISRALVDWLEPRGGVHRRLESRWRVPVKPGDSIQPTLTVKGKHSTTRSDWLIFDIEVHNQRREVVATAESLAEFPREMGKEP